MLSPVLVTAPTVKLVSTSEAKAHCRVDTADEDALLTAFVDAATSLFDGFSGILGRAMLQQEWRQDFDGFSNYMLLRVDPLINVQTVTYFDTNNVQQTVASSVYAAFSDASGLYLTLKPGQSWPSTYARPDAVSVTWSAGFGTTADKVPAAIKQAMLLLIGHWYENREASIVGVSVADLPFAVDALLAPFRRQVV